MQALKRPEPAPGARNPHPAPRAPADPLRDLDDLAETIVYGAGQEICGEDTVSDYWYRIVTGSARRCIVRAGGRRQPIDDMLPGDYFGFYVPDDYGFAIDAGADGAAVARYPRWCVEFLAEVEPGAASALRDLARRTCARLRARVPGAAKTNFMPIESVDRFTPVRSEAAWPRADRQSQILR